MASDDAREDEAGRALIAENRARLAELRAVLTQLTPDEYRREPGGGAGSVGAQARHLLDGIEALIRATLERGRPPRVSYGARRRGDPEERSRELALERIDALTRALEALAPEAWCLPVVVSLRDQTLTELAAASAESTLLRELAVVASHATHHLAIIRLLLRALGHDAPADFGVSPATLRARAGANGPDA